MNVRASLFGSIALAVALAGCGGGGTVPPPPTGTAASGNPTGLAYLRTVTVPGFSNSSTGVGASFDISAVDNTTGNYFLADRNTQAVDIINTKAANPTVTIAKPVTFTGNTGNPGTSGPDGMAFIPGGNVYVGDVNRLIVMTQAGALVANIPVTSPVDGKPSNTRVDEGCYDPADNLMMFATPEASTPFVTFVDTTTNTIVKQLAFDGSANAPSAVGLEQCVYDPATKNFFINNDGSFTPVTAPQTGNATTPNTGELDAIPAATVRTTGPVVTARYSETNAAGQSCGGIAGNPTGLALGPNEELMVGCSQKGTGSKQISLIMSAATGQILSTITQVGGEDEVYYDAAKNRFYTASNSMTATGTVGVGNTTPVIGVINAATMQWIGNLPSPSTHSVAVDQSGNLWIPNPPTGVAEYQYVGP